MPKSDEQKAVSVYMPLELYQQLMEFKNQENLRSDSQAINLLVGRYLNASTGNVDKQALRDATFWERGFSPKSSLGKLPPQTLRLTDRGKAPYQRLSQLEATISDIASRLKQVEITLLTNVSSNVPATEESTLIDNVLSNVPATEESTLIDNVPGNVPATVLSESPKLVVCKLYKNNLNDPQSWRYWAGAKAGFVEDLSKAKTYTDKGSTKVINQLLEDDLHKPTSRERISQRALEELKMLSEKLPVIC